MTKVSEFTIFCAFLACSVTGSGDIVTSYFRMTKNTKMPDDACQEVNSPRSTTTFYCANACDVTAACQTFSITCNATESVVPFCRCFLCFSADLGSAIFAPQSSTGIRVPRNASQTTSQSSVSTDQPMASTVGDTTTTQQPQTVTTVQSVPSSADITATEGNPVTSSPSVTTVQSLPITATEGNPVTSSPSVTTVQSLPITATEGNSVTRSPSVTTVQSLPITATEGNPVTSSPSVTTVQSLPITATEGDPVTSSPSVQSASSSPVVTESPTPLPQEVTAANQGLLPTTTEPLVPVCSPPPLLPRTTVTHTATPSHDVATYVCSVGTDIYVRGTTEVTCTSASNWPTATILCAPTDCWYTHAQYGPVHKGTIASTPNGYDCQPWALNEPQSKNPLYDDTTMYPSDNYSLQEAANFCRVFDDGSPYTWCYENRPSGPWGLRYYENCLVPVCPSVPGQRSP